MSLFGSGSGLSPKVDKAFKKATSKFENYVSGAAGGKINKLIGKLERAIPAKYRALFGSLFSEDAPFDPLQNLMFKVVLPFASFSDDNIKSINLPFTSLEVKLQKQFGGINAKYASGTSLGDLSITFYETSNVSIISYFDSWMSLVRSSRDGTYGLPNDYKRLLQVVILDYEGNDLLTINCPGAFPKSISSYNMDVSGGDIITPTITFSVDDIALVIEGSEAEEEDGGLAGTVDRIKKSVSKTVTGKAKGLFGMG